MLLACDDVVLVFVVVVGVGVGVGYVCIMKCMYNENTSDHLEILQIVIIELSFNRLFKQSHYKIASAHSSSAGWQGLYSMYVSAMCAAWYDRRLANQMSSLRHDVVTRQARRPCSQSNLTAMQQSIYIKMSVR